VERCLACEADAVGPFGALPRLPRPMAEPWSAAAHARQHKARR